MVPFTFTGEPTVAAPLTTLVTSTRTVPADDHEHTRVELRENGHPELTGQVDVAVASTGQARYWVTVNTEV
jgi:hypothetical protein